MKPKTSFEIYRLTLQRKEQDALDFVGIGAKGEARRIRADIMLMHFDGVTGREAVHLAERVKNASAAIDRAIEEA